MDYYSQALKLDEELKNFQGTARHLGNIGNIYYAKGDYKRALDNYLKVLQLMQKNGEKSEIVMVRKHSQYLWRAGLEGKTKNYKRHTI